MNKKLFYIVCTYLIFTMILSCNDDYGGGCGDTQFDYVHTGVITQNVIRKTHRKGESVTITTNDSVSLDTDENLGIVVAFQDSTIKNTSLCFQKVDGQPLSRAYATPATLLVYVMADTFESFRVLTLNEFDSTHKANSEVTEYFMYIERTYNGSTSEPIDSILGYLNGQRNEWHINETSALLVLQEMPNLNPELKFKIVVTFTSGKSISVETRPIIISS